MAANSDHSRECPSGRRLEHLLFDALQKAGWKLHSNPPGDDRSTELLARRGRHRYVIELKSASEGRRDRLVPLLSQAVLQARTAAGRSSGASPMAVIAAPVISEPVVEALRGFARDHAPDVAIGVLDRQGLRAFVGAGLDQLNARPKPTGRRVVHAAQASVHLFSDLNQWMLKVLLAPHLHRHGLLSELVPRGEYHNASELAKAANVSVMSAFRFIRQLEQEQFLDPADGVLRLVRLDALLRRWQAAYLRPVREWRVRWILPGDERRQLPQALEALGERACLGLFAAARALNLGHVEGVPLHIYVDSFRAGRLRDAGFSESPEAQLPGVLIRVPPAKESVFRGVVHVDNVAVSDVLQVWLDTAVHPARGREQADLIHRNVIKPMIQDARARAR